MTNLTYAEARDIGKTSLSDLITSKLISGEGIGKSFSSSIGQKFSARQTRLKETFDPLNMIKFLTGGSNIGPALLGRMLGRNVEDVEYFTGGGKSSKTNTSKSYNKAQQRITFAPFYTKLGPGAPIILKNGDSVADIVTKIYRLMKNIYDREDKQDKKVIKGLAAAAGASAFGGKGDKGAGEEGGGISPWWLAALSPLLMGMGGDLDSSGVAQAGRWAANRMRPSRATSKPPVPSKEKGKTSKGGVGKPTTPKKYSKADVEKRASKFKKSDLLDKKGNRLRGSALAARVNKLERAKANKPTASKLSKTYERLKKMLGTLNSIDAQVPDPIKKALSKILGFVSKTGKLWPIADTAVDIARIIGEYEKDKDEEKLKRESTKAITSLATASLTAPIGGSLGALFGRIMGFALPLPGTTFAGGLVGAYYGGKLGGIAGEALGAMIYDNLGYFDSATTPEIKIPQEVTDFVNSAMQLSQDASTQGAMFSTYLSDDIEDIKNSTGNILNRLQSDFMNSQDQLDEFQNGTATLSRNTNNVMSNQGQASTSTPGSPPVRNSVLNNQTKSNYRNSVVN